MSGKGIYVNYGAGRSTAPDWLNFDASPSLRLERIPVLGRFLHPNADRFPQDLMYGDIVRGLPVAANSASGVYASHVLEHLSYEDFWVALENTHKMLRPGGVFRLIVPDLEGRARRYLEAAGRQDPDAAERFFRETYLGQQRRRKGLTGILRQHLGNSAHLWMWDAAAIAAALKKVGFTDIRRCEFGDALDPAFASVEDVSRFSDEHTGDVEIAFEAKKPAAVV
jgi:SAM-dependent methyltransferase